MSKYQRVKAEDLVQRVGIHEVIKTYTKEGLLASAGKSPAVVYPSGALEYYYKPGVHGHSEQLVNGQLQNTDKKAAVREETGTGINLFFEKGQLDVERTLDHIEKTPIWGSNKERGVSGFEPDVGQSRVKFPDEVVSQKPPKVEAASTSGTSQIELIERTGFYCGWMSRNLGSQSVSPDECSTHIKRLLMGLIQRCDLAKSKDPEDLQKFAYHFAAGLNSVKIECLGIMSKGSFGSDFGYEETRDDTASIITGLTPKWVFNHGDSVQNNSDALVAGLFRGLQRVSTMEKELTPWGSVLATPLNSMALGTIYDEEAGLSKDLAAHLKKEVSKSVRPGGLNSGAPHFMQNISGKWHTETGLELNLVNGLLHGEDDRPAVEGAGVRVWAKEGVIDREHALGPAVIAELEENRGTQILMWVKEGVVGSGLQPSIMRMDEYGSPQELVWLEGGVLRGPLINGCIRGPSRVMVEKNGESYFIKSEAWLAGNGEHSSFVPGGPNKLVYGPLMNTREGKTNIVIKSMGVCEKGSMRYGSDTLISCYVNEGGNGWTPNPMKNGREIGIEEAQKILRNPAAKSEGMNWAMQHVRVPVSVSLGMLKIEGSPVFAKEQSISSQSAREWREACTAYIKPLAPANALGAVGQYVQGLGNLNTEKLKGPKMAMQAEAEQVPPVQQRKNMWTFK